MSLSDALRIREMSVAEEALHRMARDLGISPDRLFSYSNAQAARDALLLTHAQREAKLMALLEQQIGAQVYEQPAPKEEASSFIMELGDDELFDGEEPWMLP